MLPAIGEHTNKSIKIMTQFKLFGGGHVSHLNGGAPFKAFEKRKEDINWLVKCYRPIYFLER